MRGQALLAIGALSAALLVAQPAAAQHYGGYQGQPYQGGYVSPDQTINEAQCQNSRTNRTIGGAAIGAILGAVIGNNVGHHPGQGTLPGAVLGGVAGGAIGRGTAHCNTSHGYQPQQGYNGQYQQPYQQGYDDRRSYNDRRYDDDGSGLYGGPSYRQSSYGDRGDPNCRWGQVSVRDPDGYISNQNVYMCRGRDGQWRAQN